MRSKARRTMARMVRFRFMGHKINEEPISRQEEE